MSQFPSSTILLSLLHQGGYRTTKRLGQHFLNDSNMLTRIADATAADKQTLVLEIGPGPATLTTLLADRAGGVVGVELDTKLQPFHQKVFSTSRHVDIVYADALRVDLWRTARDHAAKLGLTRLVLAGNLPFQITSPLLFGQLGEDQPWSRMVVMVQREVAERIIATPGGREYGILTVKLAYWWKVREKWFVSAGSFSPPPKVDGAVLVLDPLDPAQHPSPAIWPGLSAFIDAAFNQRRKKLYNSLSERWPQAPAKDKLREAMTAEGINPDARAENLSPSQFQNLYQRLTAPTNDL